MRTSHLIAGVLAALALWSSPAAAQGRWVAAHLQVRNPDYVAMQQMFAQQDPLGNMNDSLNQFFPLPSDVTVEVVESGWEDMLGEHVQG